VLSHATASVPRRHVLVVARHHVQLGESLLATMSETSLATTSESSLGLSAERPRWAQAVPQRAVAHNVGNDGGCRTAMYSCGV
jgi:hypothetical protein